MYNLFPIGVEFPLTSLSTIQGIHMTCLRRVNAMDAVRVVLNVRPTDVNKYVTAGSPMRITWGSGDKSDEFIGYVHSYRPISDGYAQNTLILGVSAAYPMFTESGRTFYRVGIHNVAEEIGDDYRFQVDTDPHPLMHEQILQGDDSDWDLLQRLGDEWGYSLHMRGVNLIFRNTIALLEERYKEADYDFTQLGVWSGKSSSLISFQPSFTAVGKSPLTRLSLSTLGPTGATSNFKEENIEGMFVEQASRQVSGEKEEELLKDVKLGKLRFVFTAKAVFQAPFGKYPLDVYRIDHEEMKMTWAILSVKHVVTGGNYTAEMVLGSDGENRAPKLPRKVLDVPSILDRKNKSLPAEPFILNSLPYFAGTGANAVIGEQRWKARVLRVPQKGQK